MAGKGNSYFILILSAFLKEKFVMNKKTAVVVKGRPVVYGMVERKEFERLVTEHGLTGAQGILTAKSGRSKVQTERAKLRDLKGFSSAALKLLPKISLPTLRKYSENVELARGPRPMVEVEAAVEAAVAA